MYSLAPPPKKILSIQVLRGIAACSVVFFHVVERMQAERALPVSAVTSLASLGPSGVDLFFLISGFLMTRLHHSWSGQGLSLIFLERRCERIVPLYWLFSSLGMILLIAAPHLHVNARRLTLPWVLGNFLFFPWPQPSGAVDHVVLVGWTLDYEMYFYLLFAVGLLFRWGMVFVGGVIALSYAVGLIVRPHHPWLALLTNGLLLEFLAGMGIALLMEVNAVGRRRRFWGSIMVAFGVATLLASLSFPHAPREWRWGVPAALVLLGTLWLEMPCSSWLGRFLVLLGEASYSVYLFQVYVLAVFFLILRHLRPGTLPPLLLILLFTAGTSVAGVFCWKWVERPLGQMVRRMRPAPAAMSPPSARARA